MALVPSAGAEQRPLSRAPPDPMLPPVASVISCRNDRAPGYQDSEVVGHPTLFWPLASPFACCVKRTKMTVTPQAVNLMGGCDC